MSVSMLRQRLAVSAVLATSLTVVTACASNRPAPVGTAGPSATGATPSAGVIKLPAYSVGTLLVSDGSATVTVGGAKTVFPTTVTDAAWSPDGSRIAFVAADGNVDTARPDGTGLLVLTHGGAVKRSHPTWLGPEVVFAERGGDGVSNLEQVSSNGHPSVWWQTANGEEELGWEGDASAHGGNTAPNGNDTRLPNGTPSSVAFQHQGTDGPEVWILDQNQRSPSAHKVAEGSQPALSPDGTQVAYVGADGQIRSASATPVYAPGSSTPSPVVPTVLSTGVAGAGSLVWTPDGARVAFSTASGVESVATHPSGAPGAPVKLTSSPGVATYQYGRADHIDRLYDADPVAESVAVSQARWQTVQTFRFTQSPDTAMGATLASATDPQAALAAGSVAAPLLFTGSRSLDPRIAAELKRLFGAVGTGGAPTVTILGGTDQVSAAVETAVQQLGYQTKRVTGDRYAINAAGIASSTFPTKTDVAVVSDNDPAAMAAVGVTEQVVLTKGSRLPDYALTYLSRLQSGSKIYAVGAEARDALAAWAGKPAGVSVAPLVGADDAETSVLVAQALNGPRDGVVLADSTSPSSLAAALSTAWEFGYTLLAVDPAKGLEPTTRTLLQDSSGGVKTTVVVGPDSTLGAAFEQQVGSAVGPLGWTQGTLAYPD